MRGILRGLVAQVFVLLGLGAGLWAASWVAVWLGGHWAQARPAVFFVPLTWLVAGLAGMAVASVSQWLGDRLGKVVRSGPLSWPDRILGLPAGAALGVVVTTLTLLVALSLPWPREAREAVRGARTVGMWMKGGERVCRLVGDGFPGSQWLAERFRRARGLGRSVLV